MLFDFVVVVFAALGLMAALGGTMLAIVHAAPLWVGIAAALGGGATVAYTSWLSAKKCTQQKLRLTKEIEATVAQLTNSSWPTDRQWTVPCRSVLWILSLLTALGALLSSLAISKPGVAVILGAVLLNLGAMAVLLRLLIEGFTPTITMHARGIRLPGWGNLPWDAIHGIDYREETSRGSVVLRLLIFSVPDLSRYLLQAHWIHRLFFPIRLKTAKRRIQVFLPDGLVPSAVVAQVARLLWTQNTKMTRSWSSTAPEDVNRALQEQAAFLEKYRSGETPGDIPPAIALDELERFHSANTVVQRHLRRLNHLSAAATIAAFMLFGLWLVAKLSVWF